MNYIQAYCNLPLAVVQSSSKAEYIQALIDTREKGNDAIFRTFMMNEYAKQLAIEIEKFERMAKS